MPTLAWGTPQPVNTTTLGIQNDVSITTLADGDYLAVWTDDPGIGTQSVIRAQRFNMDGTKDGAEFIAGEHTVDCFSPEVTALSNGGYVVSWTVYKPEGIGLRVSLVNPDGTSGATIINQPGGSDSLSAIAAYGQGYAIAYLEIENASNLEQSVRLRLFENTPGSPFPSEIIVSNPQPGKAFNDIEVATLSNGNIVVAWHVDQTVHYRVYDASGTAVTGDVTVAGTGPAGELSLIARGNGFMLSWASYEPDAGEAKIRGRLFDTAGVSVSADFNVVPANLESAFHPSLLALPDGRVLATWFDLDSGTLMGRTFNPATGVGEDPFAISPAGTAEDGPFDPYAGASLLPDGRVVVTWSTTAGEVSSQILDPRGVLLAGDEAGNTIYGHDDLNNVIKGGGGADTLFGLGGADTIHGGLNGDTIYGGDGDDTIYAMTAVDPEGSFAGDTVFGEDGNDTITGSSGGDEISGGKGDDTIWGGEGNDTIEGGLFFDELHGGGGNDVIYANTAISPDTSDAGDTIYGDAGLDTLRGSGGDDIQDGGTENDILEGAAGNDQLYGGNDKDRLAGGTGADLLDGGDGVDKVDYSASSAGVSINLSQNIVKYGDAQGDTLVSIENITGSKYDDYIAGNNADNVLLGGKGKDKLIGSGGNDTLDGGIGDDILNGGGGRDTMTGGGDADIFEFTAITQSAVGAQRDKIMDFTVNSAAGNAYVDRIDLSAIDAAAGLAGNQAFSFVGSAAFSGEGQIRAIQFGANTIIEVNTTGLAGAEMEVHVSGFTASTLTSADFIL
jgi:Ca2+-binding RTX toxin-like protein